MVCYEVNAYVVLIFEGLEKVFLVLAALLKFLLDYHAKLLVLTKVNYLKTTVKITRKDLIFFYVQVAHNFLYICEFI